MTITEAEYKQSYVFSRSMSKSRAAVSSSTNYPQLPFPDTFWYHSFLCFFLRITENLIAWMCLNRSKILRWQMSCCHNQPLLIPNSMVLVQHFGCLLQDTCGPQMSSGKYALKPAWCCNKCFHSVTMEVMPFSSACLADFWGAMVHTIHQAVSQSRCMLYEWITGVAHLTIGVMKH